MNGYSKMRPSSNKKTRSMDFSDLISYTSPPPPPPIHKPHEETEEISNTNPQSPEFKKLASQKSPSSSSSSSVVESAAEEKERDATPATGSNLVDGHVKLTRTCSVAAAAAPANYYSSSSPRFRTTRTTSSGIQSAVKRVFSMRRSSSVSERYCRIYDHQRVQLQPEPEFNDADADNRIGTKTRSNMKPQKKNGIVKACKRLLGF